MRQFKTLIFDFDGTIGNTVLPHLEVFKEVAREMKIDFPEKIDIEEQRKMSARELIEHYGLGPLKLAKFIKKSHRELNKTFDQIEFYPGMEELLRKAGRQYQLGILTSNTRENIEKFMRAKDLDIFDFVYCERNMFGKAKILKKIMRQQKLVLEQVLYFGDEVRDIEACREAGVKVAAVTWGFDHVSILKKSQPNKLFNETESIKAFLSI